MIVSYGQIDTQIMSDDHKDSLLSEQQIASSSPDSSIATSHLIEDKIKEAIAKIGNQGRYQKVLFVILTFGFLMSCYFLLASGYLFMNPNFNCNGVKTSEDDACKIIDQCIVENSFTVTAYIKMYCGERTTYRNAAQAMIGLGSVFGVIVVNIISDYRGRRFSYLLAIALQVLSSILVIAGSYADSFLLLAISQFLAGFASSALWTVYYVICDKLYSKRWSELAVLLANIGYGLSLVSMLIFSEWLNWKYFVYIMLLGESVVLLALTAWFLIEDPILLFTKKKYDECRRGLRRIAEINKKEHHWEQVELILNDLTESHVGIDEGVPAQDQGWKKSLSYLRTFKEREILKPALLFGILSLASFTTSFVIFYSINEVGSSYGVDIAILGVAVMLALIPMTFFSRKIPRKTGCIVGAIGQIVLSALFLFPLSKLTQTFFCGGICFFALGQYAIYIFFIVETFPQHIQSTSFGMVQTIGEFGKLISPFLVRLCDSIKVNPVISIAIVDVLLGFFFILPLKETLNLRKQIPESQDE